MFGNAYSSQIKIDKINRQIKQGIPPENFAKPSPTSCKYCLYRPACKGYWFTRQNIDEWPNDCYGKIKAKQILSNGLYRIVIGNKSDISIRGLSADRHRILEKDIKEVLFCNLHRDNLPGYYNENLFTTCYKIN